MTVISKEVKSFKHYEEMPSELRIMVIDEMEPKDRVLFSTSSKLSNIEAKKSKNYIYSLSVTNVPGLVRINVKHGYDKEKKEPIGFSLTFDDGRYCGNSGQRVTLSKLESKFIWQEKMDDSIDIPQHGAQHFKNLLKLYQRNIKKLAITDPILSGELGIESLANLEKLSIPDEFNVLYFLEKTQKPLKKLECGGGEDVAQNPQIMEYVFNVREELRVTNLKLNEEQFSRLRAQFVSIDIGSLTEKRIFYFIKSWQKNQLGFEMKHYSWFTKESTFKVRKLVQLLGSWRHNFKKKDLKIRHKIERGKYAILSFCSEFGVLTFCLEDL